MADMELIFRQFAQEAGALAVAALWQGIVLTLGLAVCVRLVPRVSAADRFRAWSAGFGVLVALPFLPLLGKLHVAADFGARAASGAGSAAPTARAWLDLDPRWGWLIAGLWLTASAWRIADLIVHGLRLRRVWKHADPIEAAITKFEVCATRDLNRPGVIGFFQPRILIPEWLLSRLTPAELEQVILHEAEHLRRRDDWTNLLQKLALMVFPLNPALAWMERQLCHEREMACDDAVVQATGRPRAYAACLTSLAERGLEYRREALSLGAWGKRPELVGRVHRLLKRGPGLSPAAARAMLVVVGSGLLFGSVEFARAPQLVDFVSAPVIAQSAVPDSVIPVADRQAVEGYRAVNTLAHIPNHREMTPERNVEPVAPAHLSAATEGKKHPRSSQFQSPLGMVETAARVPAGTQDGKAQTEARWVMLTAWEQVVTVPRNVGAFADYDVAPTAPVDAKAAVSQEWTITRLILRVDPAQISSGEGAGAAQGGADTDTNSIPAQPTAILHGGWLVLQL